MDQSQEATPVKECWIGVDQSLNSTGMTIQFSDKPNCMFFQFVSGSCPHSATVTFVDYHRVFSNTDDFSTNEINLVKAAHNLFCAIYKKIQMHCIGYDIINVAIEGQAMSGFSKNQMMHLTDLVKLVSILEYNFLKIKNCRLRIFPATTVKKSFTGNGRAKKEQMIETFRKFFPHFDYHGKIDDVVDSFALSQLSRYKEPPVVGRRKRKVKKTKTTKK